MERLVPDLLTRRRLAAAPASAAASVPFRRAEAAGASLAAIERAGGGRLGVFALDTFSGRSLALRADERFLLQSTFKLMLAAATLSRVAGGADRLDTTVRFGRADLVEHSPDLASRLSAGTITVDGLVRAIMLQGDNGAANLLLRRLGGPPALTAFVRALGDDTTRFDRYEPVEGWSGEADTSTPRAIVATTRAILFGATLAPPDRARLLALMRAYRFGAGRLRAAIPSSWRPGDRTGTSEEVCNDILVATPPGRAPLVVAAFDDLRHADPDRGDATLTAVGATIVRWAGQEDAAPVRQ